MVHARRIEKRMVEACDRRMLEFPLDMDAREIAKELKREGWYAWAHQAGCRFKTTLQPQHSLVERSAELELIPFCRAAGLGVLPYGPLGWLPHRSIYPCGHASRRPGHGRGSCTVIGALPRMRGSRASEDQLCRRRLKFLVASLADHELPQVPRWTGREALL